MEAPSGKVIIMIIACISLVGIFPSEACSASRNEPTITTTAQPNTECVSQREYREMGVRKKLFKIHFVK